MGLTTAPSGSLGGLVPAVSATGFFNHSNWETLLPYNRFEDVCEQLLHWPPLSPVEVLHSWHSYTFLREVFPPGSISFDRLRQGYPEYQALPGCDTIHQATSALFTERNDAALEYLNALLCLHFVQFDKLQLWLSLPHDARVRLALSIAHRAHEPSVLAGDFSNGMTAYFGQDPERHSRFYGFFEKVFGEMAQGEEVSTGRAATRALIGFSTPG